MAQGSGTITTLATFNGPNGAVPYGALIPDSGGNLYGTTNGGGASGYGTVFELQGVIPIPKTDQWTGANAAVDTNWSDGKNWSDGFAPAPSQTVIFTNNSSVQSFTSTVDAAYTIAGLNIDSTWGGAINVNAPLTVTGNLTLASGGFGGTGAVSIGGKASTWTGGTIFPGTGGLTNKGTLTIDTSSGNLGLFTPISGWLADGNANDSGLDGNKGTLQGGATFAPGITGQAFSLNGTSAYVSVPNAPSLDPTNAITVGAWINPAGHVGATDPIVKKAGEGTLQQDGYALEFHDTNDVKFFVYISGTGWVSSPEVSVPLGQWSYVAGTYSAASGLSLYVNGQLIGTTAVSGQIAPSGNTLDIGHDPSNANRWYNGLIDDVSVYDQALTAAEIQVIMNEQGAGTLTNNGTINLRGTNSLFLGNGATLNDARGAQFNVAADANISSFIGSTFTNAGTLDKTGGTGTSTIASTLNNTGTVKDQSGTLSVTGAVKQVSGSTLTAGTWDATGSAKVPATLDITSSGKFTTIGAAAHVTLDGPNSTFSNLVGLTTIDKGGSFSLLSGQSFTTPGALTNNGSLTLGPGSVLTVSGSFTQSSTGTLTIQLGGTNSAPTFGQLVSTTGSITLAGNLSVTSTVVPAVGSSFELLDNEGNAAVSGTFAKLAEGATFTVKKGSTTMTFKISYKGSDGDGSHNVVITRIS